MTAYYAMQNNLAPHIFIPLALRDGAQTWYRTLSEDIKSDWSALKEVFIKCQSPPRFMNVVQVADVFTTKQEDN